MPLERMGVSKIAVIGDVHSNILALKACLKSIYKYENSSSPVDIIVFMGDLLTYGVRPSETLHEVLKSLSLRPTILLLGNHDQLYLDLISGSSRDYYNRMPTWIKESVDFNLRNIDSRIFLKLEFLPHYIWSGIMFSHANFSSLAFDSADWRYVNTLEEHLEQLRIVSRERCTLGVLGHTHRSRCYSFKDSVISSPSGCVNRKLQPNEPIGLSQFSFSILNAGSIGQPRENSALHPTWLLIELENYVVSTARYMTFSYDIEAHLKDTIKSGLSRHCIKQLISFF